MPSSVLPSQWLSLLILLTTEFQMLLSIVMLRLLTVMIVSAHM